jgi:D-alanyl-D-alanine dipeptidase
MVQYNCPIPQRDVPSISDYKIEAQDEPIISLKEAGFFVDPQYNLQGVPGSYPDCYARETVVKLLKDAESLLPEGLKFKIYDGYRPICIQQRLWNHYRREVKNKNPELNDEAIDKRTAFFVSKPSYDVDRPSLHNTGGAVDLTLVTDNGYALNMGTQFDDFTDRAWTNHFETYETNPEVQENRRILYNVMIEAGFTNLPSEWWHYDYGTKFWAYFTGNAAKYKGILDIDFPDRFPLF